MPKRWLDTERARSKLPAEYQKMLDDVLDAYAEAVGGGGKRAVKLSAEDAEALKTILERYVDLPSSGLVAVYLEAGIPDRLGIRKS